MSNCKPVGPKAFTGGHSGYEAPKTGNENGISLDADRKISKKNIFIVNTSSFCVYIGV